MLSEKQKDDQWNLKIMSALRKMESGRRQILRGGQEPFMLELLSHSKDFGL